MVGLNFVKNTKVHGSGLAVVNNMNEVVNEVIYVILS